GRRRGTLEHVVYGSCGAKPCGGSDAPAPSVARSGHDGQYDHSGAVMRALIILFAGGVLGAIVAGWLATTRDGVALDDALSHGTIGREPLDMQRDRPESTPDLLD